jgi:hypothetical protein
MKKCLYFPLTFLSFIALAEQPPVTPNGLTQATFVGQQANLVNDDGHCSFAMTNKLPMRLEMAWPCRFTENQQKSVRIESYRDAEILMVERSEPLPAPNTDCIHDRQVIRYFKNKLEVAPVRHTTRCGPGFWDQKTFVWQFDW